MTPKVERLVNLTVALLEARRPMTFDELKRRTRYYDQPDTESARRMFERDKAELRTLGIPIETREVAFGEDLGYRIPRPAYELPDLDLTAEEVAALALALQLTGADHSRLALAKLAARAPDPGEVAPVARTRIDAVSDAVDVVVDAVAERTPVTFTYRTAAGDVRDRVVHPHAVAQRRGAWYLIAHDRDRGALRVFRLDRIEGRILGAGRPGAFEHPDDLDVPALVAGPEGERVDVELAVADDARWEVELRGATDTGRTHGDRAVLRVTQLDRMREIAWLLGFASEVEVLAPLDLRAEVESAFARIAEAHR